MDRCGSSARAPRVGVFILFEEMHWRWCIRVGRRLREIGLFFVEADLRWDSGRGLLEESHPTVEDT